MMNKPWSKKELQALSKYCEKHPGGSVHDAVAVVAKAGIGRTVNSVRMRAKSMGYRLSTTPRGNTVTTGDDKALQVERARSADLERQLKRSIECGVRPLSEYTGQAYRFGALGDSHFGSRYDRHDLINRAYDIMMVEGIKDVYHAGDISDGMKMYRGQEFELDEHGMGFGAQADHIIKDYPQRKGMTTYVVGGNHDFSFMKNLSADIFKRICKRDYAGNDIGGVREDIVFCGWDEATVTVVLNKTPVTIMMCHPSGGSSYALCFDDKTEVMTETRGWQLFRDLTKTDRVGTLNPATHAFEWQLPVHYTDQAYDGDMYHFKARSFDMMVTPNHRMYVRRYPEMMNRKHHKDLTYPTKSHYSVDYNWQFKTAEELSDAKRQQWQMTRCASSWVGLTPKQIVIPYRESKRYGSTPVKHFNPLTVEQAAELIAWYVTEGYIDLKRKSVSICQSKLANPENHKRIISLLKAIGCDNLQVGGQDDKDITVCSVELAEWLDVTCGRLSSNVHLPLWLKNCSQDILELVFQTMVAGDGWQNGPSVAYKSISKQLRADIAEIAIKLGYTATEHNDSVSIAMVQKHPTINEPPTKVPYNGRVYCVTVPNSIILVRRNGRSVFSGNSYKPQKYVESLPGGRKPHVLLMGHFHKAEYMPVYRNVATFQVGTLQSQTPHFMRPKGLQAHLGFWIIEVRTTKDGLARVGGSFVPFYES